MLLNLYDSLLLSRYLFYCSSVGMHPIYIQPINEAFVARYSI